MISLVTFAKSRVVTGWFFELWGGSLPDAHPSSCPPRRTPYFPHYPRTGNATAVTQSCAIVTIPPSLLLYQGDAKPINTHRAGVGLAV